MADFFQQRAIIDAVQNCVLGNRIISMVMPLVIGYYEYIIFFPIEDLARYLGMACSAQTTK